MKETKRLSINCVPDHGHTEYMARTAITAATMLHKRVCFVCTDKAIEPILDRLRYHAACTKQFLGLGALITVDGNTITIEPEQEEQENV